MTKERIDQILDKYDFIESREKAKRSIMAGIVFIDNIRVEKPSEKYVAEEILDKIRIKGKECAFVSRAGLKLEKAIKKWNIKINQKTMLDVGSSTGGFTDCALQNGAKEVYALDVGTNQLAYKLRVDKRVKVFEKTNFRNIEFDVLNTTFDVITMDVSFISVTLLLDSVKIFLKDDGIFICLIKPQFEVGKNIERNSKGVIIDKASYVPMIDKLALTLNSKGLYINDLTISPIKGGKGNIEFLAKITKDDLQISKEKMHNIVMNV